MLQVKHLRLRFAAQGKSAIWEAWEGETIWTRERNVNFGTRLTRLPSQHAHVPLLSLLLEQNHQMSSSLMTTWLLRLLQAHAGTRLLPFVQAELSTRLEDKRLLTRWSWKLSGEWSRKILLLDGRGFGRGIDGGR